MRLVFTLFTTVGFRQETVCLRLIFVWSKNTTCLANLTDLTMWIKWDITVKLFETNKNILEMQLVFISILMYMPGNRELLELFFSLEMLYCCRNWMLEFLVFNMSFNMVWRVGGGGGSGATLVTCCGILILILHVLGALFWAFRSLDDPSDWFSYGRTWNSIFIMYDFIFSWNLNLIMFRL